MGYRARTDDCGGARVAGVETVTFSTEDGWLTVEVDEQTSQHLEIERDDAGRITRAYVPGAGWWMEQVWLA